MNLEEQEPALRQLVEKVGYDGRTGKVTVSFKSASVKELCQKGGNERHIGGRNHHQARKRRVEGRRQEARARTRSRLVFRESRA